MLNSVNLIGRLGQDPEHKHTQGGSTVCNLSVATSRKDKNGQDVTQWHRVSCFGKTADNVAKYLAKGSLVHIQGEITYSKYTDREGVQRYGTNIVAFRVLFLESRNVRGGQQQQPNQHEQDKANGYQQPPQQVAQQNPQYWQQPQQGYQGPPGAQVPVSGGPYGPPPMDDDVPF